VPTGVAIRDPRGQLFDAAERVLLRDGLSGLTSRAVTTEAGVAKGVLHLHQGRGRERASALARRIHEIDQDGLVLNQVVIESDLLVLMGTQGNVWKAASPPVGGGVCDRFLRGGA